MMKLALSALLCASTAMFGAVCANTTNCTFNLNSTEVGAFGSGPYGTVNLELITNTIKITVDLADGFTLVDNGNAHRAFTFNDNLGGAAVTMSSFSSSSYSQASDGDPNKNSPFGQFTNAVARCEPKKDCPAVNVLSFLVSTAGGFTNVNQLVKLSTGGTAAYFAADISDAAGNTGAVGTISSVGCIGCDDTVVPEPSSYAAVLALGFGALAYFKRRHSQNVG